MKASIHITDFDQRYWPDISIEDDLTTGISDDPETSRANTVRTLVLMFITVLKSGEADELLEMLRELYIPVYQKLEAKLDEREKMQ